MRGRIIANHGQVLVVEDETQNLIRCNSRRKLGLLVCGDNVTLQSQEGNTSIVAAQPRKTVLARPDRRGQDKALAANFDQILIVCAAKPEADLLLIDAYLVYAEHIGSKAVIVLNKSDRAEEAADTIAAINTIYPSLNYSVVSTCCKQDEGLNNLLPELAGRTSILVGQSGVGKSSIVKTLLPDREIQTQAICEITGLGNHTTTTTTLYHLPTGGHLIDSPGVREFIVNHHESDIIRAGFIEFKQQPPCKFNDCSHLHEPGCSILAAVNQGLIAKQRWHNYKQLLSQLSRRR